MKLVRYAIISSKTAFSFHIGSYSFYKGLEVRVVFWRVGFGLVFTTKKVYAAYKAGLIRNANQIVKRITE